MRKVRQIERGEVKIEGGRDRERREKGKVHRKRERERERERERDENKINIVEETFHFSCYAEALLL